MKRALCGAFGALLLMPLLASCGSKFDVKGSLEMPFGDSGAVSIGGGCEGQGGYDDIAGGAQVVIKDGDGKRIGLGRLDDGTFDKGGDIALCRFAFKVSGVPDKGDIYTISIGHRDDYSFKKSEASDLELTLGD